MSTKRGAAATTLWPPPALDQPGRRIDDVGAVHGKVEPAAVEVDEFNA